MAPMSDPLSTDPYKGVRDFYPADWARLHTLFTTLRHTLALWGYEEYNASPLERAELYESKTSDEIVSEQTYTFTDRGDRKVTLRPEMTPTLARMVAAKRRELAFPLRWFSIGNRFRYERPQKGRLRQFYQIDVDLVGLPAGESDLEIITLAYTLLAAFGAKPEDFTIRINSRVFLNEACAKAGLTNEQTRAYLRLLDKKDKMSESEFDTARAAIAPVDPLVDIDTSTMEAFVATLRARGVANAVFDPTITRGFDYYTGVVFEVFDTSSKNPRALFGGGRYDNLMNLFGAEPAPAVGFAIGEVPLADFLETHGLTPQPAAHGPELYIGTPAAEDIAAAASLAQELRASGVRTFVNLTERALGDQVKDAVKRGIPHFLAYGKDEAASGTLRLKTLALSTESSVSLSELANVIIKARA